METTHDNHPQHPLLDIVANISDELDKATTFNPTFLPPPTKQPDARPLDDRHRRPRTQLNRHGFDAAPV